MTECPLTAVATPLVLIWLSAKSFEIELDDDIRRQWFETKMRDLDLSALLFQLHRLDARGAHIQTNNGLRSQSKHVSTFVCGAGVSPARFC
jgi:hypothetical protein